MTNYSTDYDLAILGGGSSSRLAACAAAQKGARVALVSPHWQINDAVCYVWQALRHLELTSDLQTDWSHLCDQWHYRRGEYSTLSPAVLRSQGIDVILESARFTRDRCLKLAQRQLKASRYLLTDGYGPLLPPPVSSLVLEQRLFCHQLLKSKALPKHITVVGQGATAVEWAYALSRVASVKLVSPSQQLLPAEDQDIQRLSAAQLKSLGIQIVVANSLDSDSISKTIDTAWQTEQAQTEQAQTEQAEQRMFMPQPYGWENLNLEQLGITPGGPIAVNHYLQTRCSIIYASGGSLGGENRPELTRQETTIALKNALFGRRYRIRYGSVFYSIHMLSPIGRWGLTERQARDRYGRRVKIFQSHCLPVHAAHVAQTNFCKLVTLGTQLIGVHLMGENAPALVTTLGNSPTMQTLEQWDMACFRPGTLFEAISRSIAQWQSRRWSEGQWRRDWADNWFNIRRSI